MGELVFRQVAYRIHEIMESSFSHVRGFTALEEACYEYVCSKWALFYGFVALLLDFLLQFRLSILRPSKARISMIYSSPSASDII